MQHLSILVVDDDPVIRRLLEQRLLNEGFHVELAEDGYAAEKTLRQKYFDVVLTDLIMPGEIGGIEVLEIAKELNSRTEVIVITAHSSVHTAVQAMKKGAVDYLEKPINFDELLLKLERISNVRSILRNAEDLQVAKDTTESAASATIQELELEVANQRQVLGQIGKIMRDNRLADKVKVTQALDILDRL
jgi:DNA-binding NtrC family response regulator